MKILIFVFLLAFTFQLSPAFAQEYVFDPQVCESVIANQAVRSSAEITHQQYQCRLGGAGADHDL